jgi:hypothetical protein
MTGQSSQVEDLRRRRALFERAMREGITVVEAERRDAVERWAAMDARLGIKMRPPASPTHDQEARREPWMMRD